MSSSDVVKLIKEKEVRWADLRFTDTRGKEQHVSIPARYVTEEFFVEGKMFDGSSIAGWKGINESDMILLPDASTAVMDPFFEEATVNIRCDMIEPATMQGYERDPRSLGKRAEAYLKSTGIADSALFGPENEFFIFEACAGARIFAAPSTRWTRCRAPGTPPPATRRATRGIGRGSRAAIFRCPRWMPFRTYEPRCARRARRWAWWWRCITTRWPPAGRARLASGPTR